MREKPVQWNVGPRRSGLAWEPLRSQLHSVSESEQKTKDTNSLCISDFNLYVLKNALPSCGTAARTSAAQHTGLLLASGRQLVFAQPTGLHWKRRGLEGVTEERKDGT